VARKIFVLDTNVLLHDPRAILKFEENDVVIPIHVIEEVDQFKKEMSELGRNARTLTRMLDDLRALAVDTLQQGAPLESGGTLRVNVPKDVLAKKKLDNAAMDAAILETALFERDSNPGVMTTFVTMDANLRIRADALGLRAENYEGGRIDIDDLYSGIVTLDVEQAYVDMLGGRNDVAADAIAPIDAMHPSASVVLRNASSPKHTALGRYDAGRGVIRPLRMPREGAWGVRPRNVEQSFALDLLLDDSVHLVTLVGKAGTGKTLLAIAAGLRKVIDDGAYARLLVSRPVYPLGKDLGFLPGTIEDKLNPWMQPIFDNLEYIFATGHARPSEGRTYEELIASRTIQVEALTYIRGRSLPNQFLIVDEAQNLTPHEVKTIITRCGAATKIVLTGDPHQIDNPYVDAASNGLSIVAERFKLEKIAGHVTLTKGERSVLADRATELL
jgi:PhoH-like ATPase